LELDKFLFQLKAKNKDGRTKILNKTKDKDTQTKFKKMKQKQSHNTINDSNLPKKRL